MNVEIFCRGCMRLINPGQQICPRCGFDQEQKLERSTRSLPEELLLNSRYLLGRILEEDNGGITYLALDTSGNKPAAIREYFPIDLADRDTGTSRSSRTEHREEAVSHGELRIFSGKMEAYQHGLEDFAKKGRNLPQFSGLSGMVLAKDFFFANGTAYLVMDYAGSQNLEQFLQQYQNCSQGHTPMASPAVLDLMEPVLYALAQVHEAGMYHGNISPEHILVNPNGSRAMLDFGAALISLGTENQRLNLTVNQGYTPEEQHRVNGTQGSWTDVYEISAVLYRMISGMEPSDVMERLYEDDAIPLKRLYLPIAVPDCVSDAIEKGMALRAKDRCRSAGELYQSLTQVQSPTETQQPEQMRGKAETRQPEQMQHRTEAWQSEQVQHKAKTRQSEQIQDNAEIRQSDQMQYKTEKSKKQGKKKTTIGVLICVMVLEAVCLLAISGKIWKGRNKTSEVAATEHTLAAAERTEAKTTETKTTEAGTTEAITTEAITTEAIITETEIGTTEAETKVNSLAAWGDAAAARGENSSTADIGAAQTEAKAEVISGETETDDMIESWDYTYANVVLTDEEKAVVRAMQLKVVLLNSGIEDPVHQSRLDATQEVFQNLGIEVVLSGEIDYGWNEFHNGTADLLHLDETDLVMTIPSGTQVVSEAKELYQQYTDVGIPVLCREMISPSSVTESKASKMGKIEAYIVARYLMGIEIPNYLINRTQTEEYSATLNLLSDAEEEAAKQDIMTALWMGELHIAFNPNGKLHLVNENSSEANRTLLSAVGYSLNSNLEGEYIQVINATLDAAGYLDVDQDGEREDLDGAELQLLFMSHNDVEQTYAEQIAFERLHTLFKISTQVKGLVMDSPNYVKQSSVEYKVEEINGKHGDWDIIFITEDWDALQPALAEIGASVIPES